MQEAAGICERASLLMGAMRGWTLEKRSFAEEAQRMEHFLDGARARIETLALQVLLLVAFGLLTQAWLQDAS